MTIERSLVLVKPPHSHNPGQGVIHYADGLLAKGGYYIHSQNLRLLHPPKGLLRRNYDNIKNSPYFNFEEMLDSLHREGVIPAVYIGRNIARRMYDITGPTDPSQGEIWQIRRHFSTDTLAEAKLEYRCVRNVFHRSGLKPGKTVEDIDAFEGEQEIALWAQFLITNGVDIPELSIT